MWLLIPVVVPTLPLVTGEKKRGVGRRNTRLSLNSERAWMPGPTVEPPELVARTVPNTNDCWFCVPLPSVRYAAEVPVTDGYAPTAVVMMLD